MIGKLNTIILYSVITFFISLVCYPLYIRFLCYIKAGKTIREDDVTGQKASIFQSLHGHKSWTPTMWGGLFLLIVSIMVILSVVLQQYDVINNSLFNRQETYILLFGFFSMWLIGLIDDILNIRNYGRVKWLSALWKTVGMTLFAAFISYWFYFRLWIDWLLLWPGGLKIDLGFWFLPISFFSTLFITHAINITDGLDGLAWWMMSIVLSFFALITFINQTYIATTLIWVVVAVLISFLRYNINPAKVFMGDSGAFSLGGLLAALVWLLNIRIGIALPFVILFALFIIELLSSFFQMLSKKIRGKKMFPIAPFHHLCEYYGMKEHTVVMRFWLIQGLLAIISLMVLFYADQFYGL